MPEAMRSSVVLPLPEGPSRQTTSAGAMSSEKPLSASPDVIGALHAFEGQPGGDGRRGASGRRLRRHVRPAPPTAKIVCEVHRLLTSLSAF